MPSSVLTPAVREEIGRLGRADIMVGIPTFRNATTIGHVVRAAQAGLVQYFPDLRPVVVNSDAGSADGTGRVVIETEPPEFVEQILLVRPTNRLTRVSLMYPAVEGVAGKGAAVRTILEMARALRVQALVLVDGDLRSIVPEWIELLAGPILKGGYDFVGPLYARHKHDGTITNSISYPLGRALYGHRLRQPIGGDVGLSGDLVGHYLEQPDWTPDVSRFGIDAWLTTTAIAGGFALCQARLGAKIHDSRDPAADLDETFREILATTLRLAIRHAARWLPIRGSHDVPAYGFERLAEPGSIEVDPVRLLARFHTEAAANADTLGSILGRDVRAGILACAADAGSRVSDAARRSAKRTGPTDTDRRSAALAGFEFPDELWVRVVYDALIAVERGGLPVEVVANALVPLYFGRTASVVIGSRELSAEEADEQVEMLAREFERRKPSLVDRWTAVS